jgi:hypothetical protein
MAVDPNIKLHPQVISTTFVRVVDDEKPTDFGEILDEDWIVKGKLYPVSIFVDRSFYDPEDPMVLVLGDGKGNDIRPNETVWSIHPRRVVPVFKIYNN